MSKPSRAFTEGVTAPQTDEVFLIVLRMEADREDPASSGTPVFLVNNSVAVTGLDTSPLAIRTDETGSFAGQGWQRPLHSFDYAVTAAAGTRYSWGATDATLSEESLIKRQGRNSLKVVSANTGSDTNVIGINLSDTTTFFQPGSFSGDANTVLTFLIRPERTDSLSATDGIRVGVQVNPADAPFTGSLSGMTTFGTDDGLVAGKWATVSRKLSDFVLTEDPSTGLANFVVTKMFIETNRINRTDGDVCYFDAIYIGEQVTYLPFPFVVELPSEVGDTEPRATLVADVVDQLILTRLLEFTLPPTITMSVVLASDTNVVEAGPWSLIWQDVTFTDRVVRGNLEIKHVLNEPFPAYVFDPQNHAGLFR